MSPVGGLCSFDAFRAKYRLDGPALARLACIVRGADTSRMAALRVALVAAR